MGRRTSGTAVPGQNLTRLLHIVAVAAVFVTLVAAGCGFFILAGLNRSLAAAAGAATDTAALLSRAEGMLLILLLAPLVTVLYLYLRMGREFAQCLSDGESLRRSERRYRTMFDSAPAALWEEDLSAVKEELDALKVQGVTDVRSYLDLHPEFVERAIRLVKVNEVNHAAVGIYGARSKEELLGSLHLIFTPETAITFKEFLVAIANGRRYFVADSMERKLTGETLNIVVRVVIPEDDAGFTAVPVGIVDVTEQRRAEDALRESRQRYQQLAELLPQTVFEADREGRVTFVNRAAFHIFGYDAGILPEGLNILQVVVPEERDGARRRLASILGGDHSPGSGVEYTLLKKDHTTISALTYCAPLFRCGKPEGIRGIVVDVTPFKRLEKERRQAEDSLRQAKEAADRANRAKSDFLASMSHEIRTPLTSIIGFTELLQSTEERVEQKKYVEMIRKSGEILLGSVNDILDLAKIEAGKLELERIVFRLSEVVERCSSSHAVLARQKGLRFTIEIDPAIPPLFRGDPERLRQALANMVSNAVKFTSHGEVSLCVSLQPSEDSPSGPSSSPCRATLLFTVTDTGIGIPLANQSRIFDSYIQAVSSTFRRYGGSGLGMTIVRKLVDLMEGDIRLDSTPGLGTAFYVTLHLEVAEEGEAECVTDLPSLLPSHAGHFKDKGRLHILVAEDNTFSQMLLSLSFRSYGHEVTLAVNGQEAVALWRQGSCDLILMDVQMPEMSGLEATEEIRRIERTCGGHIPIVAMTANAFKEDCDRCLAAGMDGYLTKPLSVSQFLHRLLGEAPQSLRVGGAAVQDSGGEADGGNLADLFRLEDLPESLHEDKATLSEYFGLFMKDIGRSISQIDRCIREGNRPGLACAAHTIKGTAAYLRDSWISQLAVELEQLDASVDLGQAAKILELLRAEYETLAVCLSSFRPEMTATPPLND